VQAGGAHEDVFAARESAVMTVGQVTHVVAPVPEKDPERQRVQILAPDSAEKVPLTQRLQTIAPKIEENLPAGQRTHSVAPTC